MGDGAENYILIDDMICLLGLDDVILLHNFDTAVLALLFVLD